MALVLVFRGGREARRSASFDSDVVVVGSSPDADLPVADDPFIEPEHFVIKKSDRESYQIVDRHTRHGTFVNDRKITSARLNDGDVIRAGLTVFEACIPSAAGQGQTVLLSGMVEESFEALTPTILADDPEPTIPMPVAPEDDLHLRADLAAALAQQGYELGRLLGRGSFGRVYQAFRPEGQGVVAVKVLDGITDDAPKRLQLFLREISVHENLVHPHIVRLLSTGGIEEKVPWFIMEYVEGQNLDQIIRAAGARLGVRDSCRIVCQILEALDYAHYYPPPDGPFVHRDVKLSNILISGGPGTYVAKLADFGLAKNYALAGWSGMTTTGRACGTLEFMPPEQARDSKYAGPEYDLYAMGGVLFYCLTGRLMYDVDQTATRSELLSAKLDGKIVPLRSCCPGIPEGLQEVVDRAVGRDQVRRYRGARQMIRALEHVMSSYEEGEAPSDVGERTDDSR